MSKEIKEPTRKEFLKRAAIILGGLALSGCAPETVFEVGYQDSSSQGSEEEKPAIIPEEGIAPLTERKVEVPKAVDFVDMDLARNKAEVGNWSEATGLKYGELAEDIPAYNFTDVKSPSELEARLKELYPSIPEAETDPKVRGMELFVNRSVVEEFNADGVSLIGWANRHIGFLNFLLAENKFDLRIALKRIVLVEDKLAANLDWHFLQGRGSYHLPQGTHNRLVMATDYRGGSEDSRFHDLNFGWIHEMGHYFLSLWDLYSLDFGIDTGAVEIKDKNGSLIPVEAQAVRFSDSWLMIGGKRPILSPFSIKAIEHLEKINVSSWEEAYDYWTKEAFWEISQQNYVCFRDKSGRPLKGKVSLFVAKPDKGSPDGFTLHRHYGPDPDIVLDLDERGGAWLPPELIRGYAYSFPRSRIDPLSFSDDVMSFGKNFLLALESNTGEKHYQSLTSFDFLLATWEARPERYPGITITTPETP